MLALTYPADATHSMHECKPCDQQLNSTRCYDAHSGEAWVTWCAPCRVTWRRLILSPLPSVPPSPVTPSPPLRESCSPGWGGGGITTSRSSLRPQPQGAAPPSGAGADPAAGSPSRENPPIPTGLCNPFPSISLSVSLFFLKDPASCQDRIRGEGMTGNQVSFLGFSHPFFPLHPGGLVPLLSGRTMSPIC